MTIKGLFAALFLIPVICVAAPYVPKDEIKTEGKWKLVTVVLDKGTSSQIVIGKLEYDGREVIGQKDHRLATPFGEYVWRGEYRKGYMSGWITLDSDIDIKEVIQTEIDPSEKDVQLFTKKKPSQPPAGGAGKPAPQP